MTVNKIYMRGLNRFNLFEKEKAKVITRLEPVQNNRNMLELW
jgi:hypothetical protein